MQEWEYVYYMEQSRRGEMVYTLLSKRFFQRKQSSHIALYGAAVAVAVAVAAAAAAAAARASISKTLSSSSLILLQFSSQPMTLLLPSAPSMSFITLPHTAYPSSMPWMHEASWCVGERLREARKVRTSGGGVGPASLLKLVPSPPSAPCDGSPEEGERGGAAPNEPGPESPLAG